MYERCRCTKGCKSSLVDLQVAIWHTLDLTLFEPSGFKHEGCIRGAVWKEGKWVDTLWLGMLASEYEVPVSGKANLKVVVDCMLVACFDIEDSH